MQKSQIIKTENYLNYSIHPKLIPYVKSIEIEPSNNLTSVSPYTVIPDLFVVAGFQLQGSLYQLQQQEKHRLSRSGISGIQTTPKIFVAEKQTKSILIRFYHGQFMNFLVK